MEDDSKAKTISVDKGEVKPVESVSRKAEMPKMINMQETRKEDIDWDNLPEGTVIVDEVKQ